MERDVRRRERRIVMKPIEYLLISSITGKTSDGFFIDMSDSGACLLTTAELENHQRIIIRDKSCSSEKVAIVKWSEKYDDMLYKVGLEFTNDQASLKVRGRRRYKRLNIENLNVDGMNGKMALSNYIKIIDMSLDGLSIETDKKLNIGEEYLLHLAYEGRTSSIKGSIAWCTLERIENTNKGEAHHIYKSGMKLTVSPDEMREFIRFISIRLRQKGGEQEYFYLNLDELGLRGKDGKYLESSLRSR